MLKPACSPLSFDFAALLPLAFLSLVVAGCQDSGGESDESLVSKTCNLVEIARSAPEANLTSVKSVDVDSKGRIYVADWPSKYIRVLSPEGDLLKTIGRSGEGPGEFSYIQNLQVLPGDSLLVYDLSLGRATIFAPDSAEVAGTFTLVTSEVRPPSWAERTANGSFLGWYRRSFRTSDDPSQDNNRKIVLRVLDGEGMLLRDSILTFPGQDVLVARDGRWFTLDGDPPLGRDFHLDVGPEGRIFYSSSGAESLSIEIFDLQGDRVGGFAIPHEAPPVTDQDVANAFAAMSESWRETFRVVFEERIPETWPAIEGFVVSDEGHVWMDVTTPAGEEDQLIAFEQSGSRICTASLPKNIELELVSGGKVYGVVTNEMDVPQIIVYQIQRQPV